MTRLLFALLVLSASASAQHGRVAVGLGTADLGDFQTAFEDQVASYQRVASGVAAQRTFPAWRLVEAEGMTTLGPVEVGGRVQGRWAESDALYGDYAGTVDVTSRVRAWVFDAQVAVPVRPGVRVAGHGGFAAVSSRLESTYVASAQGLEASGAYAFEGDGLGPTLGASVLVEVPAGPVGLIARLGARWGRVRELDATERTPNGQTEGRILLNHGLSGISLTLGASL